MEMTFFERELRKIFGDGTVLDNLFFTSHSCAGDLGRGLRACAEFVAHDQPDYYDALRISVLTRTYDLVDSFPLRFGDVFGVKPVPDDPNFPNGVSPHIWTGAKNFEWHGYQLTSADYLLLQHAVNDSLAPFRPHNQEQTGKRSCLDHRIENAKTKIHTGAHTDALFRGPEH